MTGTCTVFISGDAATAADTAATHPNGTQRLALDIQTDEHLAEGDIKQRGSSYVQSAQSEDQTRVNESMPVSSASLPHSALLWIISRSCQGLVQVCPT
jgi:hypothetical protein